MRQTILAFILVLSAVLPVRAQAPNTITTISGRRGERGEPGLPRICLCRFQRCATATRTRTSRFRVLISFTKLTRRTR